MVNMSLQTFSDNLSDNTEISLGITHINIETNSRSAKEKDCRLLCADTCKETQFEIKYLPEKSQELNQHFGSGGWQLIQWFHFCGVKNIEKAELENEFKSRKPKVNCNCQYIRDLEISLCSKKNTSLGDFDNNISNASVLSVQGHRPLREIKPTWNVNGNFNGRVKPHHTYLRSTEEIMTLGNNEEMKCGKVSPFSNKSVSPIELLDEKVGSKKIQAQDQSEGVNYSSKIISEFPNMESGFKDITRYIFHEDLKKKLPNGDNLEVFKAFQNPPIGVTSPAKTLNSLKNNTHLQILQDNLFCKENITILCSASSELQYAIKQAHLQTATEQTNFESLSYRVQSAKVAHSQQHYVEKQNVLNTNIAKPASVFSECCKNHYTSVAKQDALNIPAQKVNKSNSCMGSVLAYIQISTQKNLKRKLQVNSDDDGVQKAKRYLNFHIYADANQIESKESSNEGHTFEAMSKKVICVNATTCNECVSNSEMISGQIKYAGLSMTSGGSHKRSLNINNEMYCYKKKSCLNKEDLLLSTDHLLDFMKHQLARFCNTNKYFTGTEDCDTILLMEQALVTDLFPKKLSGDYAGSFESACKYLPPYDESDSNKYLIRLFRCLQLGHCSIRNQIMSENNDEDICYKNNCLQADTSVDLHIYLIKSNMTLFCSIHSFKQRDSTFLTREEKVAICRENEFPLTTYIASSLNENRTPQKWNMSDQDQYKHLVKHKSIPKSRMTFIFEDMKPFISNKESIDTKEVYLTHSGALFYTPYKELPKKDKKVKHYMFTKGDLLGTCNKHSALCDGIQLTDMYLFADTQTSSEDSSHLSHLFVKEKCVNSTCSIDLPKRCIPSVNDLNFSSKTYFEKGLDYNSSNVLMMKAPPKYTEQKKQNRNKLYSRSTFSQKNMAYCVLNQNNIEKNCSKRSMESIEEVAYIPPTCTEAHNTATLKEEAYKDFSKLERKPCPKRSFFSVLDTYEKIPLILNFEDLDKITLASPYNCEEHVEVIADSSTISNTHKCTHIKTTTGILSTFPSTHMANYNMSLLDFEEQDNSEHGKGIGGTGNFFESVELYVQLPLHCPDSGIRVQSFSADGYCDTLLSDSSNAYEVKETAINNQITIGKSKYFTESPVEEIKQSSTAITDLSVSEIKFFRYESAHKVTLNKHLPSPFKTRQISSIVCKDDSQHLKILQTGEQVQEVKQTDVRKQCTSERDIPKMLLQETILSDTMSISIASKQNCGTYLSIVNEERAIDFMTLLSDGQRRTEFAMKPHFDLVLEELSLFHEISREQEEELYNEERKSAQYLPQTNTNPGYEPERKKKDDNCVPENKVFSCVGYDTLRKQNKSKKIPGLCKRKVPAGKQEQEVPNDCLYSRATEDESLYLSTDEDRLPLENKTPSLWIPAFSPLGAFQGRGNSLQDENGSCFSHGIVRVQPLKTCTGPIRIGLSKKAKTKQLHPYLK